MATSVETRYQFGGLQIRNKDEISITLFCELCKLLLFNPTQLLCCGTRLCQWCSKKGLTNGEPFICPFCDIKQPEKQVRADRGVQRELNSVKFGCHSCPWNGSYNEYQGHLQQYHADLECSDCHTRTFAINSLAEHQQEICEYRCVPCGLPTCVELVRPSEMQAHYLSENHQKVLFTLVYPYVAWQRRVSRNSYRLTTTSNVVGNTDQELISIEERVDIRPSVLKNLSNDCTSEHDQMKIDCESTSVSSLNNVRLLNDDSTTIFSFHKKNDEINSPFSIFSPKFKTSTYGYLFVLRVCSTFESSNENQGYLSIYITLLRSDFDQILFYPFPYNISLCLCDQSEQRKHIVSTIIPDPNSSSFARPTNEKNNEIGIVKFCPLNYLTDVKSIYLKDGVFFTRVFIDFMNTGSIHTSP